MFMIKAVLSNAAHPEYGSIPIEFPIESESYDHTIEQLARLEIGKTMEQDCRVDELTSWCSVLKPLETQLVNIDELDCLARLLECLTDIQASKFQGLASKMGISNIRDFINLLFSCHQATVITNFDKLEEVGAGYFVMRHGGCVTAKELYHMDAKKEALDLILSGRGTVTPYGVIYDNDMIVEQVYDGKHFPRYRHQGILLVIEIMPSSARDAKTDYLYLPTSDQQIIRTLERAGVSDTSQARIKAEVNVLPEKVSDLLDFKQETLADINKMCCAVKRLPLKDYLKLNAAVLMAKPACAREVCQLTDNLERFDFVPNIHTTEGYGRYMIQKSGCFSYDPGLAEFYDYKGYAAQKIDADKGQFNECGYISYQGSVPLNELMRADSEQSNS